MLIYRDKIIVVLNFNYITILIVPFGSYHSSGESRGDHTVRLCSDIGIRVPYCNTIFLCYNTFNRRKKVQTLYLRYLLRFGRKFEFFLLHNGFSQKRIIFSKQRTVYLLFLSTLLNMHKAIYLQWLLTGYYPLNINKLQPPQIHLAPERIYLHLILY